MCSFIDFLGIDEHGVTSATTTPAERIANKRGANSVTVKIWMHGEALEVPKTSGSSGDVVAHDAVVHARNAETRTRCRLPGVEEPVEVEAPEAIEGETVEIEHRLNVARPAASNVGMRSCGAGEIEQFMTEKVQPFVHRESVLEEHGLFRRGQRWCQHGAIPGIGDRDDSTMQGFGRGGSTRGWTEQGLRGVAPPRADPHAVGMSGDGVSASHGLVTSLGPMTALLLCTGTWLLPLCQSSNPMGQPQGIAPVASAR